MKVLVYGFKPFLGLKENVSEQVVKGLKGVKKAIFDVKFGKQQFIDVIKKHGPDVIIGVGQWARGEKIRIERKAVNLKWKSKKEVPKPITKKGTQYLFTSLKLSKDKASWVSYNAGKYVCNYSMYVISNYFKKLFAFIHIPMGFSKAKATKFLEKALCRVTAVLE
jgi:pyrrolidone-carboxylate peptidase